ncbi:hypothetical protein [Natrinema sp. HArc-T2]|uniref:hypothetical protein n=1 Tax=Natrinema sp. HArc-T2 TaxID=3242701 RepID=UPI00359D9638
MRRLLQAKTAVQKRLPAVSRLSVAALLFALALLAVVVAASVVESEFPSSTSVDVWVASSRLVLWSTIVVLMLVTISGYLLSRRYEEVLLDQWSQLSSWAQAIVAGIVCGTVVAIGLGVATLAGAVPLALVPVGSLIAWPVATVCTLRQRRKPHADDSSSALESLLITVGYAQAKHLQTRTLAGIVGLVGAVLGSVGVRVLLSWFPWFDGTLTPLQTAVLAVCGWLLATVIVYNRYASTITDRIDLQLVAVSSPELRDGRELTIKNTGTVPVELTQAKLRDTNRDCYQFGVGVTLGPGACCSFAVPASFSLESNETTMALPLGYTLTQGSEHPIIYTRDGEQYVLREGTELLDRDSTRETTRQTVALGVEPTPQE